MKKFAQSIFTLIVLLTFTLPAAAGEAEAPVRSVQSIARPGREDFVFLVMPGTWNQRNAAAAKVLSYVPDNPAAGRATVQGLAVLLDVDTGSPR